MKEWTSIYHFLQNRNARWNSSSCLFREHPDLIYLKRSRVWKRNQVRKSTDPRLTRLDNPSWGLNMTHFPGTYFRVPWVWSRQIPAMATLVETHELNRWCFQPRLMTGGYPNIQNLGRKILLGSLLPSSTPMWLHGLFSNILHWITHRFQAIPQPKGTPKYHIRVHIPFSY